MKSISFILCFFLLIISIGCNAKLDFIQPVESKGTQIYLPLINESKSTAIPEENFDSDLKKPILTITETPNEKFNLETPAPVPTSKNLESEINPIIIPFEGILQSPVPIGFTRTVDNSYRYGTTQEGTRIPHDGVEFYNPSGTPVLAAADGIIYFAGSDNATLYGQFKDFYGNLIIIEHDLDQFNQPVFSLYAHLSVMDVKTGDKVKTGEKIGEVGATGSAIGSHLHFEVRLNGPGLDQRLNPELFISLTDNQPLTPSGILIGNILDYQKQKVSQNKLVIQPVENGRVMIDKAYYLETYAADVPSDPNWLENFSISNLPVGNYRVSTYINKEFIEKYISINENSLTFISIFPDK